MEFIAMCANSFIDLFKAGAQIFTGFVTGIIPLVVVLMTAVNSLIKLIGEQRFTDLPESDKIQLTRYTLAPVLSVIFLTSPMCFTFGRFVEEKYKPAFYDAQVSFVHPVTGLFPHANGGELSCTWVLLRVFRHWDILWGIQRFATFLIGIVVIFFTRNHYGTNLYIHES